MSGYDALVGNVLAKFLLLIAVLLMPFEMSPLAAAGTAHEASQAAMSMNHCPDGDGKHHRAGGSAGECTMACAGALPATDCARRQALTIARPRIQPAAAHQLDGLHPETATPPPKLF